MKRTNILLLVMAVLPYLFSCSSCVRLDPEWMHADQSTVNIESSLSPAAEDSLLSRFAVVAFDFKGENISTRVAQQLKRDYICEPVPLDSIAGNITSHNYDTLASMIAKKGFNMLFWVSVDKDTGDRDVERVFYENKATRPPYVTTPFKIISPDRDFTATTIFLYLPSNKLFARSAITAHYENKTRANGWLGEALTKYRNYVLKPRQ